MLGEYETIKNGHSVENPRNFTGAVVILPSQSSEVNHESDIYQAREKRQPSRLSQMSADARLWLI
jgi:hypothetical protein